MRILSVLALSLLLPLAGLAVPTGLNMMPTAEALGSAETRLDLETTGSGKLYVPSSNALYGSQAGIALGMEGGIDQLSNSGTRYNAKWVFMGEGLVLPAIAFGGQNFGAGARPEYYAVATKTVIPAGLAKVHAGVMRVEHDNVLMLGASAHLGPFSLKADRLSDGPRDGQSIGAGFSWKNFSLTGTIYDFRFIPDTRTLTMSYSVKPF